MTILEAIERSICADLNCISCNSVRKMVAKMRNQPTAADAPKPAPAASTAPANPAAKAPGDHVPKVFASQKLLGEEAKALRARANALDSLATALPGLTPDAIDAVHLLAEWSNQ